MRERTVVLSRRPRDTLVDPEVFQRGSLGVEDGDSMVGRGGSSPRRIWPSFAYPNIGVYINKEATSKRNVRWTMYREARVSLHVYSFTNLMYITRKHACWSDVFCTLLSSMSLEKPAWRLERRTDVTRPPRTLDEHDMRWISRSFRVRILCDSSVIPRDRMFVESVLPGHRGSKISKFSIRTTCRGWVCVTV